MAHGVDLADGRPRRSGGSCREPIGVGLRPVAATLTPARRGSLAPRRRRRAVGVATVLAVILVVGLQRDSLVSGIRRLGQLSPWWLAAAVGAEAVSYVAIAELQRHLLVVGGVRLRRRSVVALAWASDAVSASVPVGGPVSAAYTFRHFTDRGATAGVAGWVMAASGVLSGSALVGLGLIGAELRRPLVACFLVQLALSTTVLIGGAAAVVFALARVSARPERLEAVACRVRTGLAIASRLLRRSWSTGPDGNPSQVDFAEPVRLGGVAGMVAFSVAIANWVFDGAALVLSLVALGVAVPLCGLVLVYVVGQLGSSVPFLPGALGLAEGSLTLALVCVGVRPADAVAAALTYRFVSFWLQLPVGWVVWMQLRRRRTVSAPDEAALVAA